MLWEEDWEAPRWQRILETEETGEGRAGRIMKLSHYVLMMAYVLRCGCTQFLSFCHSENLETDYFGKLEHKLSILRNLNDQVLFINQGDQPVFEDMPDSDCTDNAPRTEFIIYMYKDSLTRGLAVTISVNYKTMSTLSCENKIISFKEMSPPESINDEGNDIIFFQRSVPGHDDKIQFESSLYKGYFLACEKEKDLFKLILKKKDENGDKSIMFTVQNKN
ncbi:interleukin-18 isoform X1 [Felis catus]|uniref:Interleukin-18 n=1 Tax=Felis catus TaxID=9685 RepID=A0ABI7ZG95_FELCA|nr:interleukin-18 isoform X1 [Felis catus]